MDDKNISNLMLLAIEDQLKQQLSRLEGINLLSFLEMMTYHLGWTGEGSGPNARGKRIRPLLLLLISASKGNDWHPALPAAAAVELVHNFSLVHDDIQDNSVTRRNRLTIWKKWGIPMAINTGDALFAISNLSLIDLSLFYPSEKIVTVIKLLQNTCFQLTCGQYLDMAYETLDDVSIEDYWTMINFKTTSLIKVSCEIGALLSGANQSPNQHISNFGHFLGMAFQAQDDLLGIWGSEYLTGKSNQSDLISKKKTLPILFGLHKGGEFYKNWKKGVIHNKEISDFSNMLVNEGALDYTRESIKSLTHQAIENLHQCDIRDEIKSQLLLIINQLLSRNA